MTGKVIKLKHTLSHYHFKVNTGAILQISLRVGVIPLNIQPWHGLFDHLSQFTLTKSSEAQTDLSAALCTTHRLYHCVWLVARRKQITKFSSTSSFWSVQRVVSRPLQPIARMAPVMFSLCRYSWSKAPLKLYKWLSLPIHFGQVTPWDFNSKHFPLLKVLL